VSTLIRIALLAAVATIACGFNSAEFEWSASGYQGEPVAAAIARLGPPIQIAHADGQRVYYWRTIYTDGRICKIWGAARHAVIFNWGYQDCT
jgi:hypothetical protein